jgi:hypothetical protein
VLVGEAHIAGFTAIRAIVETVSAQANILLRLAKAAVLFAGALPFRFVALRTERNHCDPLEFVCLAFR